MKEYNFELYTEILQIIHIIDDDPLTSVSSSVM